jgi:predicted TIM-barrel fold metal-dependent hydrolase
VDKPGNDALRNPGGTTEGIMVARIIAIEEHFWTPELIALRRSVDQVNPKSVERLGDLGALRLREMDSAGIDMQVLSEAEPGVQNLTPELAVPLARASNDLLFEAVKRSPGRFAGLATLPTPDPAAAARELGRAVRELRFCGAMVHGSTRGRFLDEREFWTIFECAAALDVPIYLHPCTPQPAVFDAYYRDYPQLSRAALGFGIEMAVQASRLVVSGVLDEFPKLKIILGHLGESLPFVLWRADDTLARRTKLKRSFRDYFRDHFHITTSGNFSPPALQCAIAELGVERILFAVDWPFQPNKAAVKFIEEAKLTDIDREQIFGANARRLLRI